MTTFQKITRDIREYQDSYIEDQLKKYQNRKYNICIKMEHDIYTQEQADKNYERASKIYNMLAMEKSRRMQEKDIVIRQVLKSMQGQSMFIASK